jgi:hypothetical protein
MTSLTTFHTYPDLLFDGGRLAAKCWGDHPTVSTLQQDVRATIAVDSEAVVLRASGTDGTARGLMPGGLG